MTTLDIRPGVAIPDLLEHVADQLEPVGEPQDDADVAALDLALDGVGDEGALPNEK